MLEEDAGRISQTNSDHRESEMSEPRQVRHEQFVTAIVEDARRNVSLLIDHGRASDSIPLFSRDLDEPDDLYSETMHRIMTTFGLPAELADWREEDRYFVYDNGDAGEGMAVTSYRFMTSHGVDFVRTITRMDDKENGLEELRAERNRNGSAAGATR